MPLPAGEVAAYSEVYFRCYCHSWCHVPEHIRRCENTGFVHIGWNLFTGQIACLAGDYGGKQVRSEIILYSDAPAQSSGCIHATGIFRVGHKVVFAYEQVATETFVASAVVDVRVGGKRMQRMGHTA